MFLQVFIIFQDATRIWELRYNHRRPMKGGDLNKFDLILNEVSLAGKRMSFTTVQLSANKIIGQCNGLFTERENQIHS